MSPAYGHAAVVGSTAWGTTLAVHLARNGQPVTLLTRTAEEAAELRAMRTHARRIALRKASTLSRLREPRRTVEIGCWLRLQLQTFHNCAPYLLPQPQSNI